jgi:heme-degrading monooxygenase HmoA
MPTLEGKVRSLLVLQPRGGDPAALLDFFRRHDVLGLAVRHAGCWTAELQVPVGGAGPVVVTAVWDDAAAYDGWRNHPVRASFNADMERLVESEPATVVAGGVYQVAVSAARPDAS